MGRLPLSSFEFKFASVYLLPLPIFKLSANKRRRSLVIGGKWGSYIDASWAFAPLWRNPTDMEASSFTSRCRHVVTIGRLISLIKVNSCLGTHIATSIGFVRLSSKREVLDFKLLNACSLYIMRVVSINNDFTFLPSRFLVTLRRLMAQTLLVPVLITAQCVLMLVHSLVCRILLHCLCPSNLSLHRKTIVTLFLLANFL